MSDGHPQVRALVNATYLERLVVSCPSGYWNRVLHDCQVDYRDDPLPAHRS